MHPSRRCSSVSRCQSETSPGIEPKIRKSAKYRSIQPTNSRWVRSHGEIWVKFKTADYFGKVHTKVLFRGCPRIDLSMYWYCLARPPSWPQCNVGQRRVMIFSRTLVTPPTLDQGTRFPSFGTLSRAVILSPCYLNSEIHLNNFNWMTCECAVKLGNDW